MKEIKNKALKEKTSVLKKLYSYWNVFFLERVNNEKKKTIKKKIIVLKRNFMLI